MLGIDVLLAVLLCSLERELDHLLDPGGGADLPRRRLFVGFRWHDLLQERPHFCQRHAQSRQLPAGQAFFVPQQSKQYVLGADVARFIKEPQARLAEIPLLVRDLKKRKEEAIERGDYEAAAQHRLEETRLREEFHEAMNAWRDSLR